MFVHSAPINNTNTPDPITYKDMCEYTTLTETETIRC